MHETLDTLSHIIEGLGDAAASSMKNMLGDHPGVGSAGDVGDEGAQ